MGRWHLLSLDFGHFDLRDGNVFDDTRSPDQRSRPFPVIGLTVEMALVSERYLWPEITMRLQKLTHWPLGDMAEFFNPLAPGRSECDSKNGIFNLVLLIGIFRSSHDNALRWMPQDFTDDKSTLVQVMAWCRQATSHYLSQCWLSLLSPYGVAMSQWVKIWCWNS